MLPSNNSQTSKKSLRSLFTVSAGSGGSTHQQVTSNKNASSLLLQQPQLNQRSLCVGDLISVYYQNDDEHSEENGEEIGFMSVKGYVILY